MITAAILAKAAAIKALPTLVERRASARAFAHSVKLTRPTFDTFRFFALANAVGEPMAGF